MVATLAKASLILIATVSVVAFVPAPTQAASFVGQHQYLGDVNGDGYADAVTYDIKTGDWWVAPSNGTIFTPPSRWITGFAVGSSNQFVKDITNDGRADLITYDSRTGDWWAVVSTGFNSFSTPFRWLKGHGVGSKTQLMGDINGDGKADAVVFFDFGTFNNMSGTWWAATANVNSNGFDAPGQWRGLGHGTGSHNQLLGDVDGDGLDDAVVFFAGGGQWYVAQSDGATFTAAYGADLFATWAGASPKQFLSDIDGDGDMDAVVADSPYGSSVYGMFSNGTSFDGVRALYPHGLGNSNMMHADIYGVGEDQVVVFDKYTGDWWSQGKRWITGFGVGTN